MKRSFSLLEMLIVFTLIALLSGSFFFWTLKITSQAHQKKELLLSSEMRLLDLRLGRFFSRIDSEFFFTDEEGLVLYYDNGIQEHPLLSSYVLAKLYYNQENRTLELLLWPTIEKGKEPEEHFVLCSNIDGVSFQFYSPTKNKMMVAPEMIGDLYPKQGWLSTWKHTYQTLPTFVKLILHKEGKELCFSFSLLEGEKPMEWLCR